MLNVALISHSPYVAGGERMLMQLAAGLQVGGRFKPTVLLPHAHLGEIAHHLTDLGVAWRSTPDLPWYISRTMPEAPEHAAASLAAAQQYAEILRECQADVVVVNTLTNLGGPVGATLARLPYVLWIHGVIDYSSTFHMDEFKDLADGIVIDGATTCVTCSSYTHGSFRGRIPESKLLTINNWTAHADARDPHLPRTRLCTITTLIPIKGVDLTIRAIAHLRSTGLDVGLDVYGDGELRDELPHLARKLKVADLVKFHGRTDEPQRVLRSSFATIVASRTEALGLVAMESLAVGTPVISSNVGGLPEVVHHDETGLLFPAGDFVALAECIRRLVADPAFADRLGSAGRELIDRSFSSRTAVLRFESVLTDAVKRNEVPDLYDGVRVLSVISQLSVTSPSPRHSTLKSAVRRGLDRIKRSPVGPLYTRIRTSQLGQRFYAMLVGLRRWIQR